ncbi:hypothetical protein [Natrononativus amylolyticus]|uniref:hypothetical protein n=1 Tax=Natrononativus amylolyticus TaxID=2963434 RepID=UPI0020CE48D5|nr:hypothetical protein [Natrononativus amylolyticus]
MARTPTRRLHGERSNAYLSWTAVAVALLVGGGAILTGTLHEAVFAASVAAVTLLPAIVLDSRRAALPWEIPVLAVVPLVAAVLVPDSFARQLILYAGAAPLALALTLEANALTEIRLERWLAVGFVTMLAATIAALWATLTWLFDSVAGTAIVPSNDWVMWLFIVATGTGLLAGVVFDRYYRGFPGEELVSAPVDGIDQDRFAEKTGADDHPTLEEHLPLPTVVQRGLVWAMRLGLFGMLAYGVLAPQSELITNAGLMLAITFVPTLLRRRYDLPFDAGLVLWVTTVVFLHALGSAYFYERTFWWHNLTHPLSATLVGAIGYAFIRTLDEHRDDVHLPPGLVPLFVVVFVAAFGVVWEISEFGFDVLAAAYDLTMPLTQHGLDDTMTDVVFNTIGASIVAAWGLPYLDPVTDAITDRLEGWPVVDYDE